jgi:hypothetical protein
MLLVMACSGAKNSGSRAAAIKYRARQFGATLDAYMHPAGMYAAGHDLVVLSAEFGIVPAYRPIPDYDTKMTAEIADRLIADEAAFEAFAVAAEGHDEVAVFGGKLYRHVVAAWADRLGVDVTEIVGDGRGCGDHFSALKNELLAA